jgi:long-chain acyl-CoA synthetase
MDVLDNLLAAAVSRDPHRVALVCGETRLTYAALDELVSAAASRLESAGALGAGPVACALPNSVELVGLLLACARLGAPVLPLNPRLTDRELADAMTACGAGSLVAERRPAAPVAPVAMLASGDLLSTPPLAAPGPAYAGLAHGNGRAQPDAPFLMQFSSGSTGRPKRIVRTQRNLCAESGQFTRSAPISTADRILAAVPLYHAHGLGNCLLAALRAGASLVLLEPRAGSDGGPEAPFATRCREVCELVEAEGITVFPAVPYMLSTLAESAGDTNPDLGSIRLCVSAGNHLPRSTFERFRDRFGISIRQLYGCTEAGSLTLNRDDDVAESWDSVGHPLDGVAVLVVDERRQPVPAGTTGEVAVASLALAAGYADAPAADAAAFAGGWFFTGDLGRLDGDGRLFLTGRKKLFVATGGYKVNCLEVEDALAEHPCVAEVAVVGSPTRAGDELVKAVVVCRQPCEPEELVAFCRQRLADHKVPRIVEIVAELPRSPLGKVLRKDLVGSHPPHHAVTPRQALRSNGSAAGRRRGIDQRVSAVLAAVLGVDTTAIDRERPLTLHGLTSVMAVDLCRRLADELEVEVPAVVVWDYPTVTALAAHLAGLVEGDEGRGATPEAREVPAGEMRELDRLECDAEFEALEAVSQLSDEEALRLLNGMDGTRRRGSRAADDPRSG